jgi:uncharacterized repeat protein (TIGR01451 family)
MKNSIAKLLLVLGLAFAPAMASAAPGQVALEGGVQLEKTVVENGQSHVVLSKPDVVVPGDRLLFTTSYANGGAEAVKNFVVTNPLPEAVALAPDAVGSNAVSVDGGKTFGPLAGLTVAAADGSRRAATASDVTHIRWTIPVIAAGASGQVEYHAIVR